MDEFESSRGVRAGVSRHQEHEHATHAQHNGRVYEASRHLVSLHEEALPRPCR